MSDDMQDINIDAAHSVFATLCTTLDNKGWSYSRDDDKLKIECGAKGEDMFINIRIYVEPELKLITLLSELPCPIPEERRVEAALAVCIANYAIADGSFDFNIESGKIVFRMTSSFRESLIGSELFEYMLVSSCYTVDKYNDRFFLLAKGKMSVKEFVAAGI